MVNERINCNLYFSTFTVNIIMVFYVVTTKDTIYNRILQYIFDKSNKCELDE